MRTIKNHSPNSSKQNKKIKLQGSLYCVMLPSGWKEHWSKGQNKTYYFNKDTNVSVWTIEEAINIENNKKKNESSSSSSIANQYHTSSVISHHDDAVQSSNIIESSEGSKDHDEKQDLNNQFLSEISESKRMRADSNNDGLPASSLASAEAGATGMQSKGAGEIFDVMKPSRVKEMEGSVAIIVPFRDLHIEQKRMEHLHQFVPHMIKFLGDNAGIEKYHIYIIEQSDDGRKFNRGKLLNIGYVIARDEGYSSFVFHDVDLLPQPVLKDWYAKYPERPIHIAKCWDRYNGNDDYLGGIVSFNRNDFERVDGFPNIYWGWGGEDDELRARLKHTHITVESPSKTLPNAIVDLENMDLKQKLAFLKKTDWKCNVKWEVNDAHKKIRESRSDHPRWWGLKELDFDIISRDDKKFLSSSPDGESKCSIIKVDVHLNYEDKEKTMGHWSNTKMNWQ